MVKLKLMVFFSLVVSSSSFAGCLAAETTTTTEELSDQIENIGAELFANTAKLLSFSETLERLRKLSKLFVELAKTREAPDSDSIVAANRKWRKWKEATDRSLEASQFIGQDSDCSLGSSISLEVVRQYVEQYGRRYGANVMPFLKTLAMEHLRKCAADLRNGVATRLDESQQRTLKLINYKINEQLASDGIRREVDQLVSHYDSMEKVVIEYMRDEGVFAQDHSEKHFVREYKRRIEVPCRIVTHFLDEPIEVVRKCHEPEFLVFVDEATFNWIEIHETCRLLSYPRTRGSLLFKDYLQAEVRML